jgi:hypothetical protein
MVRVNKKVASSYLSIIDEYKLATGNTQYALADVYDWALARGRLETSPEELKEYHVGRFSAAARKDSFRDAQGRSVRVRHCVEISQPGGPPRFLWSDLEDASPSFLEQSLRQRRDKIHADVLALEADLDYINEILVRRGQRPIQLSFDFTPGTDDSAEAGA